MRATSLERSDEKRPVRRRTSQCAATVSVLTDVLKKSAIMTHRVKRGAHSPQPLTEQQRREAATAHHFVLSKQRTNNNNKHNKVPSSCGPFHLSPSEEFDTLSDFYDCMYKTQECNLIFQPGFLVEFASFTSFPLFTYNFKVLESNVIMLSESFYSRLNKAVAKDLIVWVTGIYLPIALLSILSASILRMLIPT